MSFFFKEICSYDIFTFLSFFFFNIFMPPLTTISTSASLSNIFYFLFPSSFSFFTTSFSSSVPIFFSYFHPISTYFSRLLFFPLSPHSLLPLTPSLFFLSNRLLFYLSLFHYSFFIYFLPLSFTVSSFKSLPAIYFL